MPEKPTYSPTCDGALQIGLVSTFPPKLCGLATFANALKTGLRNDGHRVLVVRLDEESSAEATLDLHPVSARMVNGDAASIRTASALLSRCDVAIIQHEYGIYGGADGQEVIDLMRHISSPTIVVLHTVPSHPSAHQRSLLVQIGEMANRLVVMSTAARSRLVELYPIDESKVVTIPHGAAVAPAETAATRDARSPQLLTWGLLGPGKGIEHTIEALGMLDDLTPHVRYTVAGVTHPKVLLRDGDRYRRSLVARAHECGVADTVSFDDTYRDVVQLNRFVASASVVVLPYDSHDQVTSGVLVDAIAAGRPVIATAFPHAVELLAGGAGILVPHEDTAALAAAIRTVLTEPGVRDAMAAEARQLAPSLSWDAVASTYAALGNELRYAQQPVAI